MQNYKENYTGHDENALFEVALLSVLGDREEQQDGFGYELKLDEGLVVLCDGMGGHEGGRIASALAVDSMLKAYDEEYPCQKFPQRMTDEAERIDKRVASLSHEDGSPMMAGTTIAAVYIRGSKLHWISVGDSRVYLFRDEELVQATQDHVYRYVLEQKLDTGEITEDEYLREIKQSDALYSFLGVNGLPAIDRNETPFDLQSNDRILITTDGLYKLLSDEEIERILGNFNNASDALMALELKAQKNEKKKAKKRDNMTVALLKLK